MLFILSLSIGLCAYAQNKFEKGYIINNSGQRIECLIKNDDWKNNPTNFKYKTSETGDERTGNLANVQEFAVTGKNKYRKFTVDIDRSSNKATELSTKRTAEFSNETVFLKVLVEGSKASLYSYIESNLRRYFYKKPNGKVTQLINKQYRSSNQRVRKNESYKAQLEADISCNQTKTSPSYTKSSLVKYFIAYNNCDAKDTSLTNFTLNETKGIFRFKVKGGINYYEAKISEPGVPFGDPDYNTNSQISPRFGFELEYVLPSNNNRWSVFLEPSYQSYEDTAELTTLGSVNIIRTIEVEYQSIEIPLGVRHYVPLESESSKLFFNAGAIFDFPMGDSTLRNSDIESDISFFLGAGYEYNKFSIEARYAAGRQLTELSGLETAYGGLNIVLGYVLF